MDGGGDGEVDGSGEGNEHASFTSPCSHDSKGRDCAMSQTTSHEPDEAIQVRPLPHTPGGLVGVGVSAQHPEQLQPISCSSLQLIGQLRPYHARRRALTRLRIKKNCHGTHCQPQPLFLTFKRAVIVLKSHILCEEHYYTSLEDN